MLPAVTNYEACQDLQISTKVRHENTEVSQAYFKVNPSNAESKEKIEKPERAK